MKMKHFLQSSLNNNVNLSRRFMKVKNKHIFSIVYRPKIKLHSYTNIKYCNYKQLTAFDNTFNC